MGDTDNKNISAQEKYSGCEVQYCSQKGLQEGGSSP